MTIIATIDAFAWTPPDVKPDPFLLPTSDQARGRPFLVSVTFRQRLSFLFWPLERSRAAAVSRLLPEDLFVQEGSDGLEPG